jgi:hypothetical protein
VQFIVGIHISVAAVASLRNIKEESSLVTFNKCDRAICAESEWGRRIGVLEDDPLLENTIAQLSVRKLRVSS